MGIKDANKRKRLGRLSYDSAYPEAGQRRTLTTRIYPKQTSQGLIVSGSEESPVTLTVWDLEDRMKDMVVYE
ncbi:hypothetical protein GCM10009865_04800 [Aeromicrobium ponti]|uniref:Uncharacterized protein n=1 Tax=Cytobacillus oceanisediminis TaxID=665099 RepID=A0A562K677_9BACI|nr:hypothetical protein IQ19_00388 [Cytobacillus oceanisediminis]